MYESVYVPGTYIYALKMIKIHFLLKIKYYAFITNAEIFEK